MSDTIDNTFPRLLYKRAEGGNSQPIWGLGNFEVLEVADQAAQDEATADGWTLQPEAGDAPSAPAAFSLLDEKVAVIVEHLPALTHDELSELLAAEKAGKTRKGVIEALEEAISANA